MATAYRQRRKEAVVGNYKEREDRPLYNRRTETMTNNWIPIDQAPAVDPLITGIHCDTRDFAVTYSYTTYTKNSAAMELLMMTSIMSRIAKPQIFNFRKKKEGTE